MEHGEWVAHNSHDLYYRYPFGAVASDTEITIRLSVNTEFAESKSLPESVSLRLWAEGQGETLLTMAFFKKDIYGLSWYEAFFTAPAEPGLVWYYFIIEQNEEIFYYGNNALEQGGRGELRSAEPPSYQISVYRRGSATPAWLKNAIIYQIFPDRFANGHSHFLNPSPRSLLHSAWDDKPVYARDMETGAILAYDFFGGNLLGVIQKLPYLQELGINTIYFNPIFTSVSNHKYDTADYKNIDPAFGDNALFHELCAKAKEMGIAVILDGVFSHTGSDSIYFNKYGNFPAIGACQSPKSPYYPWYRFSSYPDEYQSWWGIGTMPNVEETEPSYLDYMIRGKDSVVKHWNKLGAQGWRLDVADELPSLFLKTLRQTLKAENPEAVIIGEVWEDASRKVSYGELRQYFDGDHLDAVMNYPFRKALLDFLLGYQNAEATGRVLLSLYENYPKENFYANMNIIGSHDVPRILTLLGGAPEETAQSRLSVHNYKLPPAAKKLAVERLKMAVAWQMTFPGAPCVYYGDEAGSEGYSDPYNRGTYPWGKENQELLAWYKKLIDLRNTYPILRTGEWIPFLADGDMYAYLRQIKGGQDVFGTLAADNTALVIFNRSQKSAASLKVNISEWVNDQDFLFDPLDENKKIPLQTDGTLQLEIKPLSVQVLIKTITDPTKKRTSGVLLHPTSLPGAGGIGDLGEEAYKFADFLKESKQKLWQVLPLNPPSIGASPYKCLSAFAGNPLLISPAKLKDVYLTEDEVTFFENKLKAAVANENRIDFALVEKEKHKLFALAFAAFKTKPLPCGYAEFVADQSFWLDDYALFMALREKFGGLCWTKWEPQAAKRDPAALSAYRQELAAEIELQIFLQYLFHTQWQELKNYVNSLDLKIIGDVPLFVAHDSADVWANPHLFQLDQEGMTTHVAGVPPDYFSATGQLWGNPLYRWHVMEQDDYLWWRNRLQTLLKLTDLIRIDHFRAFEAYWEIPSEAASATSGYWVPGPGAAFFNKIRQYLGDIPLIAEDLGTITLAVHKLKNSLGLPGMKILQFSFGNDYGQTPDFPYNCGQNTIAYTGTHDNDTLLGWWQETKQLNPHLSSIIKNHLKRLHKNYDEKMND
ncbi:MAG: 4-alpha-glucanotransferase, partial [Sporomusaceae bacterium]|nr:4-alpha-glucanotransferase [Sporomusaceae bacterium]